MPPVFPFSIAPRSLIKEFDVARARLDSIRFASALWARQILTLEDLALRRTVFL